MQLRQSHVILAVAQTKDSMRASAPMSLLLNGLLFLKECRGGELGRNREIHMGEPPFLCTTETAVTEPASLKRICPLESP